jgi:Fic-DOC domain mobile mystery protein B
MPNPPFELDDSANTPLVPEEREALIPSYITLRHELNEAEQINIGEALRWTESRKRDVLDREFMSELHRRMFSEVWRWAGQYRTTARNIGVDAYRILTDVQQAIDDARYWVDNATYPPDEIAVRFSHRIVAIHPFPNGNGRLSRLVGDLLAGQLGQPPFTWRSG